MKRILPLNPFCWIFHLPTSRYFWISVAGVLLPCMLIAQGIEMDSYFSAMLGLARYRTDDSLYQDINHDGFKDSLHWKYDGGSGSGGTRFRFLDGKTGTRYEVDNGDGKWEPVTYVRCHEDLFLSRNWGAFTAIEKAILPGKRFEHPEAQLKWLIDHDSRVGKEPETGLFYEIGFFQPYKYAGQFSLPPDYFVRMNRSRTHSYFKGHPKAGSGWGEWPPFYQGWAVFYSSDANRGGMATVDSVGSTKLIQTGRSLVVQEEDQYQCVYVDRYVDPKFGSLGKAAMIGPLVFVNLHWRSAEVVDVVVSDRDLGIYGRFRGTGGEPDIEDYLLGASGVWLIYGGLETDDEYRKFIPYSTLQRELRRWR